MDASAVRRIYEAKGRPSTSPLIVHVADVAAARALAAEWPASAQKLVDAFWPGPLTIVVKKVAAVPDEVTAGLDTVGLRVPAHPLALELLRAAGIPVAAPSANRFTQLSPTRAEHVREGLGDAVDMILDGGPCEVGIESTVVSVVSGKPLLLRPGMISSHASRRRATSTPRAPRPVRFPPCPAARRSIRGAPSRPTPRRRSLPWPLTCRPTSNRPSPTCPRS